MTSTSKQSVSERPLSQPDVSTVSHTEGSQPDQAEIETHNHKLDQTGPYAGRPDRPTQPELDLGTTLTAINSSIDTMATILKGLAESGIPKRGKRGRKSKKCSASSESEPVSDSSDYVPKRARKEDDAISLSASDNDIQALLDGSPATGDNAASDQHTPDTTGNTAQLVQVQQPPGDPSEIRVNRVY